MTAENSKTANTLAGALSYAGQGVPVFPCHPINKAPLVEHGFKDASADVAQIREWWAKWPTAMIGSPTGKITDRVVIDIDSPTAESELNILAEQANGTIPPTYVVKTFSGKHLYFRYPENERIGCSDKNLPGQINVRGDGGYVIVPPSWHPGGVFYTPIDHSPKAALPAWLLKLLIASLAENRAVEITEATPRWAWQQYHRALAKLRHAKPGERNILLNTAAWWSARLAGHPLLAEAKTCAEIFDVARGVGLDEREIRSTYNSGWGAGHASKIKILPIHECTDLGNADRFILRCGDRVKFVPNFGNSAGWLVWDGRRWNADGKRLPRKLAHETVRTIYQEAAAVEDDEIRKRLVAWAIKSESTKSIAALLEAAQPYVAVEPADLDADPELLNLENGTLDLRTGTVRDQRPSDLITRMIPVRHEPNAICPAFDQHMKTVLPDAGVRDYFLEMIAYSYSGSTGEQAIHMLYGDGDNGKSTTSDLFRNMAGDYGWVVKREFFADGYSNVAAFDVAELLGRRIVSCSEFEEGDVLRVSTVKSLTSGQSSEVSACRKYGHPFRFRPQAKFLLDSNYLLKVDSPDVGTWRRLRVIPFTQTIPADMKNRAFPDRLWEERSGIFNLIIAALKRWNARGRVLEIPEVIKKASGEYRDDSDLLARYIEERCAKEPDLRVRLRFFTERYQEWAKSVTSRRKARIGEREMKNRIEHRGFNVVYDKKERADFVEGIGFALVNAGLEPGDINQQDMPF